MLLTLTKVFKVKTDAVFGFDHDVVGHILQQLTHSVPLSVTLI
jgi:hypothetical protein